MREIFYAIYKNSTYEVLIFTSLAEVVLSKKGKFLKGKIVLQKDYEVNSCEKQILKNIYLNKISTFNLSDYTKWAKYLLNYCIKSGYVSENCFGKFKITKLFKGEIEKNLKIGFCKEIVNFIDSSSINDLRNIVKNISEIVLPCLQFPTSKSTGFGIYKDRLEILENSVIIPPDLDF